MNRQPNQPVPPNPAGPNGRPPNGQPPNGRTPNPRPPNPGPNNPGPNNVGPNNAGAPNTRPTNTPPGQPRQPNHPQPPEPLGTPEPPVDSVSDEIRDRLQLAELLFRNNMMTKIIVGPEKREFTIHKALLCHKSKYFDHAYQTDMLESRTNCFVLDEDNDQLWDMIHVWLYTDKLWIEPPNLPSPSNPDIRDDTSGTSEYFSETDTVDSPDSDNAEEEASLPDEDDDEDEDYNHADGDGDRDHDEEDDDDDDQDDDQDEEMEDDDEDEDEEVTEIAALYKRSRALIQLWVLADMRGIPSLQNAIIDQLHADSMTSVDWPSDIDVAWAWEATLSRSPLRRYLAMERAIKGLPDYFNELNEDEAQLPAGFIIMLLQVRLAEQPKWATHSQSRTFHVSENLSYGRKAPRIKET